VKSKTRLKKHFAEALVSSHSAWWFENLHYGWFAWAFSTQLCDALKKVWLTLDEGLIA
jgi:hypothetical protein